MKDAILLEVADTWELQAATGGDGLNKLEAPARETLRACSDLLRMLVSSQASQQPFPRPLTLDLNDHTRAILGRPNFTCAHIATVLRMGGHDIARKAEAEQAATLHYLLNMYLQHGDAWQERAEQELKAMFEANDPKGKAADA